MLDIQMSRKIGQYMLVNKEWCSLIKRKLSPVHQYWSTKKYEKDRDLIHVALAVSKHVKVCFWNYYGRGSGILHGTPVLITGFSLRCIELVQQHNMSKVCHAIDKICAGDVDKYFYVSCTVDFEENVSSFYARLLSTRRVGVNVSQTNIEYTSADKKIEMYGDKHYP